MPMTDEQWADIMHDAFGPWPGDPDGTRGELVEATDGHEHAYVTSAAERQRRQANRDYKREWRRRTGAECSDCGVAISRTSTWCRPCGARRMGRRARMQA